MHSLDNFTEHFSDLLKNTGDRGDGGDGLQKPLQDKDFSVTPDQQQVSPLPFQGCHPSSARGDGKDKHIQSVNQSVTLVTRGTPDLEQGQKIEQATGIPLSWYAILAELKRQDCPDWLSLRWWTEVPSDAERFLAGQGGAAHGLGWTELDVFGVHPVAPSCRYNAMGLVFFIQGGEVVGMTENTATIRRRSGSVLTFRRPNFPDAVLSYEGTSS
jgi:hypothetical protein